MRLQWKSPIAPILRSPAKQRDELLQISLQSRSRLDDVHHQERGDLVVARSRRVDPLAGLADEFRQRLLHPRMDVFRLRRRNEAAAVVSLDRLEPSAKFGVLFRGEDARRSQRRGMGPLKPQLKRKQEPVVGQTPIDRFERRMQFLLLLPQRRHFDSPRNSARHCPAN
jgi:hypothetical protein